MTITEIRKNLGELFIELTGKPADEIRELAQSGSNRIYFRLNSATNSFIGTYNEDDEENRAFFYLAEHFNNANVSVPKVLIKNEVIGIYIQEDLGDKSLYDYLNNADGFTESDKLDAYRKVIDCMPALQVESAEGMDFSKCYPREAFDRQSIQWDLNYFKYCFLKLAYVPFHEQSLEDEFNRLTDFLLEAQSDFFLFRDFQSRNIMWKGDKPYFIDFQGGRKGALQYDLASMLYESKANLESGQRKILLDYYIEVFKKYSFFSETEFKKYFSAFALIRVLQAFGAYGYRGLFEKKAYFTQSILKGLTNLSEICDDSILKKEFPYLCQIVMRMQPLRERFEMPGNNNGLTLNITSFSYKKGLPDDWSGNGGGYVFDCRALPNPGRYEQYRSLTGMDKDVTDFMEKMPETHQFLNSVKSVVAQSVNTYSDRGFTNLSIAFGCTGGQHRSVFFAEQFFEYFKMNFDVNIRLIHREQAIKRQYVKDIVQEK